MNVFEFRVEKNGITLSMPQELLFELSATRKVLPVGCHHRSSWPGYSGCRDSQIPHDGTGGEVLSNGCNWDRRRDRILSSSTYLAVAGVCAGFENIEWRRGCYCVTHKEFVSNVQKAVEQAFVVRARQPPVSET